MIFNFLFNFFIWRCAWYGKYFQVRGYLRKQTPSQPTSPFSLLPISQLSLSKILSHGGFFGFRSNLRYISRFFLRLFSVRLLRKCQKNQRKKISFVWLLRKCEKNNRNYIPAIHYLETKKSETSTLLGLLQLFWLRSSDFSLLIFSSPFSATKL